MTHYIQSISASEILDSRGNPTVKVIVKLSNGIVGSSSVPSGISTGKYEATELRDNDFRRYKGKGVLKAVDHVNNIINSALIGQDPVNHQTEIDRLLIMLDGTSDKSNLGANAIVGVSQAVACAAANICQLPLYAYLGGHDASRIPMPMINILNGGKHADNNIDFQEFMIVPVGAPTFSEAIRFSVETFNTLKSILQEKNYNTNVGDEGGFAPLLKNNEEALDLILLAIERAGFRPGEDIAIALDPAATSFYNGQEYDLAKSGHGNKTISDMIAFYELCIKKYPIISIEDGFADTDWEGFKELTAVMGNTIQIVGDDILVTNSKFIKQAIKEKTCNAALIKLNQIGTVTETIEAIRLCQEAGWNFIVSHRSGETNDSFIADFSVAMGGGQIKSGSVCRGERVAKYNRLLDIEAALGKKAIFDNLFSKKN